MLLLIISCINLNASLRFLLLLANGRIVVVGRIGHGRVALVSTMLFRSRLGNADAPPKGRPQN